MNQDEENFFGFFDEEDPEEERAADIRAKNQAAQQDGTPLARQPSTAGADAGGK